MPRPADALGRTKRQFVRPAGSDDVLTPKAFFGSLTVQAQRPSPGCYEESVVATATYARE